LPRFFAGDAFKRLLHFCFLRVVQGNSGKNFRFGNSLAFAQNVLKSFKNFRKLVHALVINDDEQKIAQDLAGTQARGDFFGNTALFFLGYCRLSRNCATPMSQCKRW